MNRRYTDDEVRTILGRAAELQAREEHARPSGPTLRELEEIARQAGISPESVREAALGADPVPAGAADDARELTIELDGILDDEGKEAVVGAIQRALGPGTVFAQPSPRMLTFTAPLGIARSATVTCKLGRTVVTVFDDLAAKERAIAVSLTVALGIPIVCAGLGSVTDDASTLALVAVGGASLAMSAVLGVGMSKLSARLRRRRLRAVMEQCARVVQRALVRTERAEPETQSALEGARARQGLTAVPARVVVDVEHRALAVPALHRS